MLAKELMIGDWVNHNKNSIRISGAVDFTLAKDYEPIPLTPEILKKNGIFKNGEFPHQDHIKIHYKDGWFITFCECYGFDILYVHELQRALRCCGLWDLADSIII